jgi:hypothetical protein
MRVKTIAAVLTAWVVSAIPATAWAGGAALTPEELARDRQIIRDLNLRELAYVRQRDAAEAHRQQASREAKENYENSYDDYVRQRTDYLRRRNAYEGSMNRYAGERRSYEVRLAAWRRAVAACKAGVTSACEH